MHEISAAAVVPFGGKPIGADSKIGAKKNVARQTTILTIGDQEFCERLRMFLPVDSIVAYSDYLDLDGKLLAEAMPDIVACPLVGDRFDCMDVAMNLVGLGYAGHFQILSPKIPNPSIVLKEARSCCPTLEIDLLFWDNVRVLT